MPQADYQPEAARRWKTIPVFISSTFRDMQGERDALNSWVFPALEARLRERRSRLEPIDLRVGVDTTQAASEREREQQILKVCLREIDRSRPFLMVLLGDRYGWVPDDDRIRAAAGEVGFATETEAAASPLSRSNTDCCARILCSDDDRFCCCASRSPMTAWAPRPPPLAMHTRPIPARQRVLATSQT